MKYRFPIRIPTPKPASAHEGEKCLEELVARKRILTFVLRLGVQGFRRQEQPIHWSAKVVEISAKDGVFNLQVFDSIVYCKFNRIIIFFVSSFTSFF
jgi:hypothetical protein